jgi:protein involved in polysaccharide export with SLBB domain
VTVSHAAPRKYYIIGPVGSAGAKELKPGATARDALADAGGLAFGKPEFVRGKILRGKEVLSFDVRRVLAGDEAANLPLEPGDLVQIEELPTVRVFLMGEVQKPGQLDLEAGMGVAQAIASAGGFTPKAAQSRTFVMRAGGEIIPVDLRRLLVKGVPDVGPRLEKGDVIVVPESQTKFAVLGEVRQPGYQAMPDGEKMTLSKAINLAGGLQGKPKLEHLYILRAGPDGKAERLEVNFKALLKGDLARDVEVRPEDLIVVPKSGRLDPGQGFLLLQGVQWALSLLRFGLF